MSSFGFLNVSGVDGVGSGSGGSGTFPGGIDKSVQFNDGGLAFGGVSTFLYDKVTSTLTVNKAKPIEIVDGSNSVGTAGQVLSSTGSGLQYVTPIPVVPGAPSTSVQFNQGGVFTGDSTFTFNNATDTLSVPNVTSDFTNSATVKLSTLRDFNNSSGTIGQVLKSSGGQAVWQGSAGGSDKQIQYNNLGDLQGSPNLTFDAGTGEVNVNGRLAIGINTPTVPRLFSLSTNANFAGPGSWDEQYTVIGESPTGSGVALGYNLANNYGVLLCLGPGVAWRDMHYSANAHIFLNTNTERFRIAANGNVGIGVGVPNGKLQFPNALSNRTIVLFQSANNEHENISMGVNTGVFRFQIPTTSTNRFGFFAATGAGASNEVFRVQGDGNVGIGTGTSNAPLQFGNTLSNRKIVLFEGVNNNHQYFGFGVNAATLRYQISGVTDSHVFFAGTGTTTSNELMRLTGTGQLTVGQSATSLITISKLGLLTGFEGYLKLGGNETGLLSNRLIGFGYNFSNNNQPAYIGYQERSNTGQTNGDLIFGTRSVTTNTVPTERMRILTTGNVGIGTTTPATVLDVNGTTTTTSLKTTTILDTANSAGTAGQILSSTGTGISWINNPVPIRYTAQFSADVVVPIPIGTSAVILRTATFATGLDFPVPPPIFSIEVLQTGDYQCSYHIDFENTGGGVGTFTTALRRASAPALTLQAQRISINNGRIGQLSDTFFVSMIAGELWDLSLANTNTCSYKNVRLVFQTI
jgi:hypothetical protein